MTTKEEWAVECQRVTKTMSTYVRPFATPISMYEDEDFGEAWGTGAYVGDHQRIFLMTAAHVHTDLKPSQKIAHLPKPGSNFVSVTTTPELAGWPVDAAAYQVNLPPLSNERSVVPQYRFSSRFSAVDGELLFWMGYPGYSLLRDDPPLPGKKRVTMFGELNMPAQPYVTQCAQDMPVQHPDYDAQKHIVLHYPSSAFNANNGERADMPNPKGMSGSLLWNTRYVETTRAGKEWSPSSAEVCGLVIAALDNPKVVLASKIEDIRMAMPTVFA